MAFEGLYVGTGALRAAQTSLGVIGHNIANINTEGYTRQRANLEENVPNNTFPGQIGTGVSVDEIQRLTDNFTKLQIEQESQSLGEHSVVSDLLDEVEEVFNETEDGGLQTTMSEFFSAFHTLADSPEEYGTRSIVVEKGRSLALKFQEISSQLRNIQTQANELIQNKVDEVNSITERIAALNGQISSAEAVEGQNANDLRDARDLLVKNLNGILNVNTYEDANKNLLVETEGAVLVAATKSIPITISRNSEGFMVPSEYQTNDPLVLTSGGLKGVMDARDIYLKDAIDSVDTLAASVIENVNRIHSQGSSLNGVEAITGSTRIANTAVNLVNAGFDQMPVNGTLYLTVYNESTGGYQEESFDIDPYMDSVDGLITEINTAFSGTLTLSLTDSNQLSFDTAGGYRLYFNEGTTSNGDTSDFLMACGVNTFFSGNSAYSIAVKDEIQSDVNLITAGASLSPGDNSNALKIADLENQTLMNNGEATFNGYYSTLVSEVGNNALVANRNEENQQSLISLLETRFESTTGVSLDEETANLLVYQRMYQAAAKYITVMDGVMETLIGMV